MARIVEGDAGTVICKDAERVKPAAVIMGTRGRSLVRRLDIYITTNTSCDLCLFFFLAFLIR